MQWSSTCARVHVPPQLGEQHGTGEVCTFPVELAARVHGYRVQQDLLLGTGGKMVATLSGNKQNGDQNVTGSPSFEFVWLQPW